MPISYPAYLTFFLAATFPNSSWRVLIELLLTPGSYRVSEHIEYQRDMQEADLYTDDGTFRPDLIPEAEVKEEQQEYRPSPPRHSHQTRAQQRKRFPFKCATCNNQFPIK